MTANPLTDNSKANPFWVLGLSTAASRQEVERSAQKLLAQLELGVTSAASVSSPMGPLSRDAEAVREAVALLRNPEQRLIFEFLAAAPGPLPERAPSPRVSGLHDTLRLLPS